MGAQRHKDIALLLATGGDHRLQAGIYRGPVVGAKTAAHFLLDLGRPQVSFGLVVGERHPLHQRKAQNGILVLHQNRAQGLPSMPRLSSQRLLPFGQSRLDPLPPIPIAAGWLVAVLAVQPQATPQLGILGPQMRQFHLETGNVGFQNSQSLAQDFCFRQLIDHGDCLAHFL